MPDETNNDAPPEQKAAPPKKASRASRAKRSAPAGTSAAKGTPWTFPKNTLEDAIRVAKAIEDKHAGNPMPSSDLATAVGFRQSADWRYGDLLRSANQYGLVTGSGTTASVSLTELGRDV